MDYQSQNLHNSELYQQQRQTQDEIKNNINKIICLAVTLTCLSIIVLLILIIQTPTVINNILCFGYWLSDITGILLGGISICWSYQSKLYLLGQDYSNTKILKIMTMTLFVFATITIATNTTFFFYSFQWKEVSLDFSIVKLLYDGSNAALDQRNTLLNILFVGISFYILFQVILSIFICKIIYKFSLFDNELGVKVLFYILLFTWLILYMFAIYENQQCQGVKQQSTTPLLSNQFIKYLLHIALLIALVSYIVVWKRQKIYFKSFCLILVIYLMILVVFNENIFRQFKIIRQNHIENCISEINQQPREQIEQDIDCQKYRTREIQGKIVYQVQCDSKQHIYVWEENIEKKQSQQVLQQACLNMNCCNAFADRNSSHYLSFSYLVFALICNGFILAVCSYQLSTFTKYGNSRLIDYIMAIINLIIFIVAIMFIFYSDQPKLDNQELTASTKYSNQQIQIVLHGQPIKKAYHNKLIFIKEFSQENCQGNPINIQTNQFEERTNTTLLSNSKSVQINAEGFITKCISQLEYYDKTIILQPYKQIQQALTSKYLLKKKINRNNT